MARQPLRIVIYFWAFLDMPYSSYPASRLLALCERLERLGDLLCDEAERERPRLRFDSRPGMRADAVAALRPLFVSLDLLAALRWRRSLGDILARADMLRTRELLRLLRLAADFMRRNAECFEPQLSRFGLQCARTLLPVSPFLVVQGLVAGLVDREDSLRHD